MSIFNHPFKMQTSPDHSILEQTLHTGIRLEVIFLKEEIKIRHTLPVNSNVSLKRTFSCKWFATNFTSEGLLTYQKENGHLFLYSTFHQYIKKHFIFYHTQYQVCTVKSSHFCHGSGRRNWM